MKNNTIFSIKVVSADNCLIKPVPNLDTTYSEFKQSKIRSVPLIRIFGSTPSGQKACLNVHGVFPYLLVPYKGPQCKVSESFTIYRYLLQVATSLDFALNSCNLVGKASTERVFKIILVQAKPFYGYYTDDIVYMKIYFYYPSDIKKAADLLLAGAIMKTQFQPFEAHIPYILQMFIDYNLHGMDFLHAKSCWFRKAVDKESPYVVVPKLSQQKQRSEINSEASNNSNSDLINDFEWTKLQKPRPNLEEDFSPNVEDANNTSKCCLTQEAQDCVSFVSEILSSTNSELSCSSTNSDVLIPCPFHKRWQDNSIPVNAYISSKVSPKVTTCELEVDILAADILNGCDINQSKQQNFGCASVWNDVLDHLNTKLNDSMHKPPVSLEDRLDSMTEKEKNFLKLLKSSVNQNLLTQSKKNESELETIRSEKLLLETESSSLFESSRINSSLFCSMNSDLSMSTFYNKSGCNNDAPLSSDSLLGDLIDMDTLTNDVDPVVDDILLSQIKQSLSGQESGQAQACNTCEKLFSSFSSLSQQSNGINNDDDDGSGFQLNRSCDQCFIKQSLEYDEIERFDLPPAWEDDDLLDYNDNVEDIQQDAFAVENIDSKIHSDSVSIEPSQTSTYLGKSVIQEYNKSLQEMETTKTIYHAKEIQTNTFQSVTQNRDVRESLPSSAKDFKAIRDEVGKQLDIESSFESKQNSQKLSKNKSKTISNLQTTSANHDNVFGQKLFITIKRKSKCPSWKDACSYLKTSLNESLFHGELSHHPRFTSNFLPSNMENGEKSSQSNREYISTDGGLQHWKYMASGVSFSSTLVLDPPNSSVNMDSTHNLLRRFGGTKKSADVLVIKPLIGPPDISKVWQFVRNRNAKKHSKESDIINDRLQNAKGDNCKNNPCDISVSSQNTTTEFSSGVSDQSIPHKKSEKNTISSGQQNQVDLLSNSQASDDAKSQHNKQNITILSMELLAKCRQHLFPDPQIDEIQAVFYALSFDNLLIAQYGCFLIETSTNIKKYQALKQCTKEKLKILLVSSEEELFNHVATLVTAVDPDFLVGYEVQMSSWGYLLSRASVLGYDLCRYLSRIPNDKANSWCNAEKDSFGADNASEIHIVGRLVLNVWRLMRTEANLCNYNFETVAFHLFQKRYPHYSIQTLSYWFNEFKNRSCPVGSKALVVRYFVTRVGGNLQLLFHYNIIARTSELARLFGIQFYEVLTRGSQFRVESMMLRHAHAINHIAVSPSTLQRAQQKAPRFIPLVMEPQAGLYTEPVIVVDFQSLYPSIVIAYNYCFSTCLGYMEHLSSLGNTPFGCTSLNIPLQTVSKLLKSKAVHVAPNGAVYATSNTKQGVLPLMLDEILSTRILIKQFMKKCSDQEMKQMLDYKQLGLKLIANVTFGYTAASFSGRMPCVEIADSIVGKARETLERAIDVVHANISKWGGRVVYGDTDSMFIALERGTSKKRAFNIAHDIVETVTKSNPRPIKLKFEKIYQPCILQTKKRYVGYAYESIDQKEPIFDAKGIETVRRDGCPAVSKILEKSIKELFATNDLSKVKDLVLKECSKILNNNKTVFQDCIIAKEYRGARYYKPDVIVPALVLARKRLAADKRSEPRIGERVPYCVVHGLPGTPLYQLIRSPEDLLFDSTLKLNGAYYVTKLILPAIDRMLSLMGVKAANWYQELPRELRVGGCIDEMAMYGGSEKSKKVTLSQYFGSRHCISCKSFSSTVLCMSCISTCQSKMESAIKLMSQISVVDRRLHRINQICLMCADVHSSNHINCQNLNCPILYKKIQARDESLRHNSVRDALKIQSMF